MTPATRSVAGGGASNTRVLIYLLEKRRLEAKGEGTGAMKKEHSLMAAILREVTGVQACQSTYGSPAAVGHAFHQDSGGGRRKGGASVTTYLGKGEVACLCRAGVEVLQNPARSLLGCRG